MLLRWVASALRSRVFSLTMVVIRTTGDTTSVNISSFPEIGAIRNGNTEWREYGPLDLSSVSGLNWSDADAVELWLSFRTGKPNPPAVPQPLDIRIGWVKLTE